MSTYGTIIGQGTFVANPIPASGLGAIRTYSTPQIIQIPSGADWVSVRNYTQFGTNGVTTANFQGTGNASIGVEFYWQRGMLAGTGIVMYKGAASAVIDGDTLVSGGFTLYDPSQSQNIGALNNGSTGVTGFTAANPAVVTVGSTAGMVPGNVVRFDTLNNQSIYSGISFSAGYGTLTATTFSVDYLNSTGSTPSTSGNWRIIPFDALFYPRRRIITNITSANPAVITLNIDHGFTVGQEVRLNFQGAVWGQWRTLNNYPAPAALNSVTPNTYIITAVDVATGVGHNTITIGGLDTTGFPSFITTWEAIVPPYTPAELIPVGEDTATSLLSIFQQTPQINGVQIFNTNVGLLADSTVNTGFLGMILGSGGNGTALTTPIIGPAGSGATSNAGVISAPDTMYWLAGKSLYGGL
jgi:hypothetical protein